MTDLQNRVAGLLYGSLVADALALGAHWIYEQEEIAQKFGAITDFITPLSDSYHPGKRSGEQTHYGDQALTLMDSIAQTGGFQSAAFGQAWRAMWDGYGDYFDHATKETLEALAHAQTGAAAASDSAELGGAARSAPLIAWMHARPLPEVIAAARTQTAFTHGAAIAQDAAEFLVRVVFAALQGKGAAGITAAAAEGTYAELDLAAVQKHLDSVAALPTPAAAEALGLSCPAAKAIPTSLLLLQRSGDSLERALLENVMIGGDSAARGLALGMILGAMHGRAAIPARWIHNLAAAPQVERFLEQCAS